MRAYPVGQIALRLAKVLSQRGDESVALIRKPDYAGDVRQAGAEPAVVDLTMSLKLTRPVAPSNPPRWGADSVREPLGSGTGETGKEGSSVASTVARSVCSRPGDTRGNPPARAPG